MVSNIKSTMCILHGTWIQATSNYLCISWRLLGKKKLLSAAQVHAAGTAWEWCQSKMEPHGVPKCEFGEL